MAVPVVQHTWQHSLNNAISSDGTQSGNDGTKDRRDLIFGIVDKLRNGGTFTVPWLVRQSCNAAAVNASGDNWSTVADVLWDTSGNTHSWIVLENTALGIFLIIDLLQGAAQDGAVLEMGVSKTNPTGGTTTAAPTSTDTMPLINTGLGSTEASAWGAASETGTSVGHAWVYHVQMTNDGLSTHVLIWYNNIPIGTWILELPAGSPTAWANGVVCVFLADTSETLDPVLNAEWLEKAQTYNMFMYHSPRLTSDSGGTSRDAPTAPILNSIDSGFDGLSPVLFNSSAHPLTGDYQVQPFWWGSNAGGVRGVYGRARDKWVCNDAAGTSGDTAPTAQPDYFRHGSLIVVWDGSTTPQTA